MSTPPRSSNGHNGHLSSSGKKKAVGGRVWAPSKGDGTELWRIAEVCGVEDAQGRIDVRSGMHDRWRVKATETWPVDPTHEDETVDDVSELNELHAAPLLAALRRRWSGAAIYTRAGPVLIAVNPHRNVKDGPGPHVRDVALEALKGAVERGFSQAIVISGESGAGKTVSATRIIEYLVECGASSSTTRRRDDAAAPMSEAKRALLGRLAASIPALEALGNASTALNANSSRFGKLIKLSFEHDDSGTRREIVGASIDEFLLEKARVATRLEARVMCERNFHVLHQLAAGRDREYTRVHPVSAAQAELRSSGVGDQKTMKQTTTAFRDLGIAEEEAAFAWRVGQAVLDLGDDDIAAAAGCLGIRVDELSRVTRERRCVGRGNDEDTYVTYEPAERKRVVDGLAKLLYAALFSRLVEKSNKALNEPLQGGAGKHAHSEYGPPKTMNSDGDSFQTTFVGILDIYGFEIFKTNSLDQLLINYANEVLQKAFDEALVAAECARYAEDEIPWVHLDMARALGSVAVVELVARPPNGLLPLLDEQVKLGERGSDAAFLTQADRNHDLQLSNRVTNMKIYSKPRFDRDAFMIAHYAGSVTYTPSGFLLKNSDPLSLDVTLVIAGSSDEKVRELIAAASPAAAAAIVGDHAARQGMRSSLPQLAESTSRKFREQMKSLEATLDACDKPAHYVRCVRPNDEGRSDIFDATKVLRQLTSSGVMDLIKVRDAGFPERLLPAAFAAEFGRLLLDDTEKESKDYGDTGDSRAVALLRRGGASLGEMVALDAAQWALDRDRNAKNLREHEESSARDIAEAADHSALDDVYEAARKRRKSLLEQRGKLATFSDEAASPLLLEAASVATLQLELGDRAHEETNLTGAWAHGLRSRQLYLKKGTLAFLRQKVAEGRAADEASELISLKKLHLSRQTRTDELVERARLTAKEAAEKAQAAKEAKELLERQQVARSMVASKMGARHRSIVVRRDVALAALLVSTERAAELHSKLSKQTAVANDRALAKVVGHSAKKQHANLARLHGQSVETLEDVGKAVADAFVHVALQKQNNESRVAASPKGGGTQQQKAAEAIALAQRLDRLVDYATSATFIFETEVAHVEDSQSFICLIVQKQARMRACRGAYKWAKLRSKPWAKVLNSSELLMYETPVSLRTPPTGFLDKLLDKSPYVDATAVVTSRGNVLVVLTNNRKTVAHAYPHKEQPQLTVLPYADFDKGGACCGPSASLAATLDGSQPQQKPCVVLINDSRAKRRAKNGDAAFVDHSQDATRNWTALTKTMKNKPPLSPLAIRRFDRTTTSK